jgi:hypothetical protein
MINGWFEYYTYVGDTSYFITPYSSLCTLQTISTGILTDREKMEELVRCHTLMFQKSMDGKILKNSIETLLNNPLPSIDDGLKILTNLKDLKKQLVDISILFFTPLTDKQKISVKNVNTEMINIYTKIENFITFSFQQKISNLHFEFLQNFI